MIRTGLVVSVILVGIMAAISAYGFATIPAEAMIARHWSLAGEADGFSPRNEVLIGMPALAALTALVFAAIPLIDPRKDHVRQSRGLFMAAWIGALALVTLAHAAIVGQAAFGLAASPRVIFGGVAGLLVLLGNFMAKSRSSWFLGFRTPWTMTSENAWSAANRTAGYLFVLTGLGTIAAAFLADAPTIVTVLVAGVLTATLAGFIVSYLAWRADPDRAR